MSEPIWFSPNAPKGPERTVYSTPIARRARLSELEIPGELLAVSLQLGVTEKLTAQIFDHKAAGGWDMFRYTTRSLRSGLYERGWKLIDSSNVAKVMHPSSGVSVVVCSGDSQTGSTFGPLPKTKRSKGDVFLGHSEMVAVDLFGESVVETRWLAPEDSKTWLLLHYHVVESGMQYFRSELSRPAEAKDGVITDWFERIILNVPLPGAITDDETADDTGPSIIPTVNIRL